MRRATLLAVSLLALASQPARAACASVSFHRAAMTYAGPHPRSMTLANFNGDAWVDALVNNSEDGGGFVLLGKPGGGWETVALPAPGGIPFDYDGDGDDDIAYMGSTPAGSAFRVLRNDGSTFTEVAVIAQSPLSWVIGDVDGDGREEIIGVRGASTVVLRVREDGSFDERTSEAPGTAPPTAGDLDGDGKDELVFVSNVDVTILGDDGSGGLRVEASVRVDLSSTTATLGDFDGNGRKDILVKSTGEAYQLILDAGHPSRALPPWVSNPAKLMRDPAVGDLDRDGIDDLIYFMYTAGLQPVLMQRGSAPRLGDLLYVPARPNGGSNDVATADVDRDGDLDAIVVTPDGLATVYNRGDGTFDAPPFHFFAQKAVDINHDGRDDLLSGGTVILAGPGGTFPHTTYPQIYRPPGPAELADLNGDGELDLMMFFGQSEGPTSLQVRIGNGSGTFGTALVIPTADRLEYSLVGDFNGDHHVDLILGLGFPTPLSFLAGNGDGTFDDAVALSLPGNPDLPVRLEAGDLDGDGDLDLLRRSGDIAWPNDGRGNFGAPVELVIELPPPPYHAWARTELTDLNGDGLVDILTLQRSWLNQGNWTFAATASTRTARLEHPGEMVLRDFNRDGKADLLLLEDQETSSPEFRVELFLGRGNGDFGEGVLLRAAERPLAVGDFNGDGAPDLAAGGFVLFNTCKAPRGRAVRH